MGAAAAVLLFLAYGAFSGKAGLAHDEAQLRQPGQIAIELGLAMAGRESPVWQVWFQDARIRYTAAERAWSARYRRCSTRRKKIMVEERLRLQGDIAEYIDPVDCLRHLARITQEVLAEPQAPSVSEPQTPSTL